MADFYAGKRVVVLGGRGFVGQHLVNGLILRGADVYVIDNLSRHNLQKCGPGPCHKLDIRRGGYRSIFLNVMAQIEPFAVFNLAAAVANVEYNQKHHNQIFSDNVQLQSAPVMVCEKLETRHFLQVSTACVYGADANAPALEMNLGGEPVKANAGYSWSKRMGERVIHWSSLPHAVIVRPSNIYGPGDWYDDRAHVIPKLIKGYSKGTAKMYGDGSAIREFIYVADVVEGMLVALEWGSNKQAYNLGSASQISIAQLHQMIGSEFGAVMSAAVAQHFDGGDDKRFSVSERSATLGWVARMPFVQGLKRTIEAHLEG